MSIGRLIVEFEARMGKFETDTGRAAKIMERRAREIEKQAKKIGTAVGVAFAGAAVAIAALVKNSIDSADELSKLSQKIGVATDELSKLNYAAKLADVDTAALQAGLVKLSKAAVEAADGTGATAEAFKALGVDVKNADGGIKSTNELLGDLAESFANAADGPEKTAAALAIFGKAGADLIPLLNAGRQGLKEAGDELERFGGVVTPEVGRAAEAFNDNLTRLQTATGGLGNQISAALLPVMVDLTDQFVEFVKDGDGAEKAADGIATAIKGLIVFAIGAKSVFEALGRTIGTTFAAINRVTEKADLNASDIYFPIKGIAKLGAAIKSESANISDSFSGIKDSMSRDIESIVKVLESGAKKVATLESFGADGLETLAGATPDLRQPPNFRPGAEGAADKATTAAKKAAKATDEWSISLQAAAEIQDEVNRLQEKSNALMDEGKSLTESLMSPNERYTAGIAKLNELLAAGAITQQTYNRAVFGLQDAFDQATTGFEKIGKTAGETGDTLSTFADQAARNMQDAFAEFLFNPFDKGLKGMLASFADTLQRMAAQAAAAEIFGSFTSMASGGILDSILGAGGGSGISSSVFDMPIGTRAIGGPVSANSPYIVGERGPELFVPNSSGKITPNNKMGGDTINNYINIPITAPSGSVGRPTMDQISSAALAGAQRAQSRKR